jgi:Rhodopirellula transposase DDE domain
LCADHYQAMPGNYGRRFGQCVRRTYPKGIVASDDQMASLNIKRDDFHGEWNYAIAPSKQ